MEMKSIGDIPVAGKRVLTRIDINVPMAAGKVADRTRIDLAAPTISEICRLGGIPILLSHLGRPGGKADPKFTLAPLVAPLSDALGRDVQFCPESVGDRALAHSRGLVPGDVLLMENVRFNSGEATNDPTFAGELSRLGDAYCNDAFASSHRAHASICGLATLLPSFAGSLLESELNALESALGTPKRPLAAVVGGSKISTKLALLGNLVRKADFILIGGAMANTFLSAESIEVGASLTEPTLVEEAAEIRRRADRCGCKIMLPVDAIVAERLRPNEKSSVLDVERCPANAMILDAGPRSVEQFGQVIDKCRTVIWNGPLGAFETSPFDAATNALARRVASRTKDGKLNSVAGGGDTILALNRSGTTRSFSYVSTAGGAFLEWMEGKTLPGIAALEG